MNKVWGYEGKRVVVCGCYSGMGEAVTRELLDQGAEVTGLDIKHTELPVKQFIEVNLADKASIDGAVNQIPDGVDALFVCSGLPGWTDWPGIEVQTVNFIGPRHLIESLVPKITDGGAIASISSVAGMGFLENMPQIMELFMAAPSFDAGRKWCEEHEDLVDEGYTFSKQCLVAYTMWRSLDFIKQGIRINCISPGPTDTPMMPHFLRGVGEERMAAFPRPIGRNSTPEEQAYPLLFLNSDAASYVTGHNLFADGGFAGAILTGQIDSSVMQTD